MIKIYLFVINWLSFSEQALSSHLHSIRFIILFTPANASVFFLTDALDRKTANDMRLRLTPANPHLREFVHDAHAHGTMPVSFATVPLQT